MEPAKNFYDSIGFCTMHPKEKLTLLCTKKWCQLPRLICYKCAHIKRHPDCEKDLIMLEDLEGNEYIGSTQNWLKEEDFRNFLNVFIKDAKVQNYDIQFQELTEFLEWKCQLLLKNLIQGVENLKNDLISNAKKYFIDNDFEEHLSLEKLRTILSQKAKDNKKDINNLLSHFFDFDYKSFSRKRNSKANLSEMKKEFEGFFEELDRSFSKLREIKDYSQFFLKKSYEISRFTEFCQPWKYNENQYDCLTFSVDQAISLTGLTIFSVLNTEKTSGLLKILEGNNADSDKILLNKNFELINPKNPKEISIFLPFEKPFDIKKNSPYTLMMYIKKGVSNYGEGAIDTISQKINDFLEVTFLFSKTIFKIVQTNGTWPESGQFLKFHYMLI